MNNNLEHVSPGNLTDPYMSSLNSANSMPVKIGQSLHNQSDQDMHQQEEEYKKSVIIIFWYQANILPVRLHHMIPTFPYFQLSKLNSLVAELGLSQNTYLDTYNPDTGQWDQHTITAVRKVETQQRLLYRLRKSLLEGLKDHDCVGIDEELKIQRRYNKSFRAQSPSATSTRNRGDSHRCACKRPSTDDPDISSHVSHKVHIPNDFYISHQSLLQRNVDDQGSLSNDSGVTSTTISANSVTTAEHNPASSQSLPTPPSSSSSNVSSDDFSYASTTLYDSNPTPAASTSLSGSSSLSVPISPYPPHPPLKRWPNDYTVAEISTGFNNMDTLVASSTNGSTMTHKAAFERVFGSRYVKSTVCRHRGVWKKAHPSLKAQYEAMGHDDRAYWGEFVRVVEGRPSSLRVTGPNSSMNPTPNVQRQGVTSEDEDGGHVDEARVMKNLQGNQGATIQTIEYESSLTPLGNVTRS